MTNFIGTLAKPIGRRSSALPLLLGLLATRFADWRRRRRDEAALQRQPDYLLRDIGIERHEIERSLRGRPYY